MAANVLRASSSSRLPARRSRDVTSAALAVAALLFCGWFVLAVAAGVQAPRAAAGPVAVASVAQRPPVLRQAQHERTR